tara:strand:+ start:234 stop:827 length:594 start_codon:yes stop_codon:yes gene_type:complete
MLKFTNTKRIESVDFEEYLKVKAFSNSFLKSEQGGISPLFIASDKVRLGSMVDGILTEPETVDITSEFYPIAKEIAVAISNKFGAESWNFLESQISFTVTMGAFGVAMLMKGRLDKFGLNRVWDLKVTHVKEAQIDALIEFMGYANQMWLYSKGMGTTEPAVLIFYSVPDKKVIYRFIDISSDSNEFFEGKMLKFGK